MSIEPKYELCQYLPMAGVGYGWVAIAEYNTEEEAINEKQKKEKPDDFMVRLKRLNTRSLPGIIIKNLPKGHNLSATKRRELWNSPDPKDFKQLM